MAGPTDPIPMDPTDRDVACFEAGIKLGAAYHQFIGTPVRPASVEGLAEAMADAMAAQPACAAADVDIDREAVRADLNRFGYTELAGDHLDVEVTIHHEGVQVRARLGSEDGYPMMRLTEIRAGT